ncbi:DUF1349 domain-containing protein [Oerskovia flava]|uniref:DUF1349 domain-containing protein n=1 Tax=Oerskovia flava TaxID=2986422 RepID=UPI002240821F|nr:DUF1349 domain-containing protein [Oerskovia sp. JB1-3-2]
MSPTLHVPGIPVDLRPSPGSSWQVDPAAGALEVTAAPHSDIFVDPGEGDQVTSHTLLNAVTLLGEAPAGDFQLTARVTADFGATFDAGVLLLWLDEKHWAKLCFELSPDDEAMVVSVVNREVSDDANAFVVDGASIFLRVSRVGRVFAYHASVDGRTWRLVRAFVLDAPGLTPSIGFEAQSPHGEGCRVVFDQVTFTSARLEDLRDGS